MKSNPPPACDPKRQSQGFPINKTLQLFKLNIIRYQSPGFQCIVTRHSVRTLTYFFNDEHLKVEQKITMAVSKSECLKMIKRKVCRHGILRKNNAGGFSTINRNNWEYQWCCTYRYFVSYNCHLVPVSVYKRHSSKFMESSAGNTMDCKYQAGQCELKDKSLVLWTPDKTETCPYIFHKAVSGKTLGNKWLSDAGDMLLSFAKQPPAVMNCNRQKLIQSQQGICVDGWTPKKVTA